MKFTINIAEHMKYKIDTNLCDIEVSHHQGRAYGIYIKPALLANIENLEKFEAFVEVAAKNNHESLKSESCLTQY